MQPLNADTGEIRTVAHAIDLAGDEHVLAGMPVRVLPRPVRRLIRTINGLSFVDLLRSRAALKAGIAVIALGVGSFFMQEDRIGGMALASASSNAGFSVSKLVVNGASQLDVQKIEKQLAGHLGKSMFNIDVDQARESVAEINWIKSVTIKKAYPDTLVIDMVEREPVALWKSGQTIYLISPEGLVIDRAKARHMHLPQVVGEGANSVASEFLAVMSRFPELVSRSEAYVRVAERRWNIVLDDGPSILLPADNWQDALVELDRMNAKNQILDREIVHIDMRLPDRLVLKLPEEDAEIRRTRIEKAIKRSWHKT
ncbi:MAG: FtsQ-type POTRA domain-containing protein [Rhizobiaceae bacterium]|nr:FtsQ-type POTRA domain-containing protein [Rhizobiaceae bacterium]